MEQRVVVFVCQHGAGRSRLAAAWFNGLGLPGWTATSAGVQPQEQVSAYAPQLLQGTPVEALLDHGLPRALADLLQPTLVVEIDCDSTAPEATRWTLEHQEFNQAMNEEIRERVRRLGETLNGGDRL